MIEGQVHYTESQTAEIGVLYRYDRVESGSG